MIVTGEVERYLHELIPAPDPVLAEMREHGARDRIPIVDATTGRLLELLARATGARRIVEVGTAIGVSTLHLLRGCAPDGTVTSFEVDPERHAAARSYLEQAGVGGRADLRLQDAGKGLEGLAGPYDLAFLDGLKEDYARHLELVLGLLRPGGLVAVDNVLMSGDAATGVSNSHWTDDQLARIRAFNQALVDRHGLVATVLPVGDGVALATIGAQ